MSNDRKGTSPGGDEFNDLLDELEAWDKTFDSLHEPDTSGKSAVTKPEPASNVRPLTTQEIGADIAVGQSDPFGSPFDDDDDELEIEIERAPASASAAADWDIADDDGDDGIEFEIEPAGLGTMPGTSPPALRPPGATPPKTTRSSPAIVRREDLERRRREREAELAAQGFEPITRGYTLDLDDDDDDEDPFGDWEAAPVTNVMAKATVDKMVETAAAFFDDDEDEDEVQLELDADFYDDIEVSDEDESAAVATPDPEVLEPDDEARPRPTAHIVRRAPVVARPSAPSPLEPTADEVVVEIEADHEELELLVDPGTKPGLDDEIISEALDGAGAGGDNLIGSDVDLAAEAASALASRPLPPNRIDSIEKLREALELDEALDDTVGTIEAAPVPAEGARALETGLAPTSLPEVDLPPELPARVLTGAVPGLGDVELALPDEVPPAELDRTDEQVGKLEQVRAAIAGLGDGPARGRLHLWAAELCGELGDYEELERHCEAAIADDPDLAPAAAPLRRARVARSGDWEAMAGALTEAAAAAGDESVGGAALAELAADLGAALGQDLEVAAAEDGDVDSRWRAMLAATRSTEALDAAAPALAEVIADEPMRLALMRVWTRGRGAEAFAAASRITPAIAGDLVAWELAARRGPSARVGAAQQIADSLEERSLAAATVDSLRIVAGEALRASGDAAATRDILAAVAERQAAHPVLARSLLAVLEPGDRETAGFLLAAVSGTALAPEAARALRRWAADDTGASKIERLRRAQALCPGDPLVRAELEAVEQEVTEDPAASAEIAVGLALAPRISGDPVITLSNARARLEAGDHEAALAELGRAELPRGELLVASEILDTAAAAGPEAVISTWDRIADDASEMTRALLSRRVVDSALELATREAEGDQEISDAAELRAVRDLRQLAPGDRVAARAAAVEVLARGREELAGVVDEMGGWPDLDPANLALDRLAASIDGQLLTEDKATDALVALDELDDPRTNWLSIVACGRTGDWQRAADRLSSEESLAGRYRAAYLLLERADDAGAAESRLTPIAEAHPQLAPVAALLDAARRKLGVRTEAARPSPAIQRAADPWTATLNRAEATFRAGDASAAIEIYKGALAERPDDPIALEGLEWVARVSVDAGPLAERALAALRAAEEAGDAGARADAYATLARIDSDITGDPASALLAWESCADLDPSRPEALRALETAYLTSDRHRDLLKLYGRLLAGAESDAETRALLRLRARSADLAGRETASIIADYRQIVELGDPVDRLALFHLESSVQRGEATPERAELERAVARLLGNDPRSAAAFLCRSGETALAYGDHAAAIARFTEAIGLHESHVPSIRGWRNAALMATDWSAFAEATEAEGATARDNDSRAGLYHLAGVAWMDKVGDSARGQRALSAVLAHRPLHEDAFARLRLLRDEVGDDEGLGDLLRQLLESNPPDDVALAAHLELAGLCRNFWEDREGAIAHMRAVLELAPSNRKAIAELSDIYWELGRWDEAADALIRRAKLETDPAILKHLFYRLGTIYADHLPDSKWAVRCFRKVLSFDPADVPTLDRLAMLSASSGDHKTALAAYERLLKLELSAEEKVRYLHRIAEIQENVMRQPAGAERALRIAFDVAPQSASALKKLVEFYTRAGDMTSIRVNLDRAAQAMRARMNERPLGPRPYVVIARVLHTREAAGVRGSAAVAQTAAELARSLGDDSKESADIAGQRPPGRPRLDNLASPDVDDLLIPRVVPAGLRVVLDSLRGRLPKYVGADVKRFGVGRSDRLKRGKHPVANLAREMADELGVGNVEVYVSSAVTDKAMVVPTSPPSVILGSRFSSIDRGAELAFALGRCLKLSQMGLALVDTTSADELDKLVAGIVRQFAPDFLAFNLDEETLAAEQHRLRRLIPGSMQDTLRPHALALTGVLLEPGMLHASLRLTGLRAGLVASGNAAAALAAALRHGGYSTSQEAMNDPDIIGMLRFAVSEEHVEIQSLLAGK